MAVDLDLAPTDAGEATEAKTPKAKTDERKNQARAYHIFAKGEGDNWTIVGSIEAITAKLAIKQHVKDNGLTEGEFVAVTERSWQPVSVKVEEKTQITVG